MCLYSFKSSNQSFVYTTILFNNERERGVGLIMASSNINFQFPTFACFGPLRTNKGNLSLVSNRANE